MQIAKLNLDFFTEQLRIGNPTTFVRYGDGEFSAILGVTGKNCDGHDYFESLGAALAQTITESRAYNYAIGPKITSRDNWLTKKSLNWIEKHAKRIEWYDSEVFLTASLAGEFAPFIETLRPHRVMFVGAGRMMGWAMQTFGDKTIFISTPLPNAWLSHIGILRLIQGAANNCDVILFSAGMTSKVLMWELFPALGKTHFMLDTGSLFDMYAGSLSRSYARKLSGEQIKRLRESNFGVVQ